MKVAVQPGFLSGSIDLPPSKSDTQRALLAAALCESQSILHGCGHSDDEAFMLAVIQCLGAHVANSANSLQVTGITSIPDQLTLPPGESGLGLRLLTAVLSTFNSKVTLSARGTASLRPMDLYASVLPKLAVRFHQSEHGFPIEVQGPMSGGQLDIDGSLSSQFISGLLMALPLTPNESEITVRNMRSGGYIDMTLATLKRFGIHIHRLSENQFIIPGNQRYRATQYWVEKDWSAASYWLVASALGHEILVKGLNDSSLQADSALLKAFGEANCPVIYKDNGIRINGNNRKAFEFDATDCPDLFPALVCFAAGISGKSKIFGVNRLIHKESNRGLVLQKEFAKLGVRIELERDEMVIHGTGIIAGGEVDSHHDHRIAMCLAIAGSVATTSVIVTNANAVSKSYPGFWNDYQLLSKHIQQ
jgi:3-phosphoshikimate 1-carboxyvinyltransferase